MPWTVIVPMNSLDRAKSRLVGASDSPRRHRALVSAMRADTVRAIHATSARLLVVTSEPDLLDRGGSAAVEVDQSPRSSDGDVVIADPAEPGLNAALRHAGRHAGLRWPQDPVAVVVGDLPALTGADLDAVLRAAESLAAAGHPRSVVVDRHGTGTTMLLSDAGEHLGPAFGVGSARRHLESGAYPLDAPPTARCDVDVPEDLDAARALGLGPHTAALFGSR